MLEVRTQTSQSGREGQNVHKKGQEKVRIRQSLMLKVTENWFKYVTNNFSTYHRQ